MFDRGPNYHGGAAIYAAEGGGIGLSRRVFPGYDGKYFHMKLSD
jgi:hypothetical protein